MKYFIAASIVVLSFLGSLYAMEIAKDVGISKEAAKKSGLLLDMYAYNLPFEKFKEYAQQSASQLKKTELAENAPFVLYCLLIKMACKSSSDSSQTCLAHMRDCFVEIFTNLIEEMVVKKHAWKDLKALVKILIEPSSDASLLSALEAKLREQFFLAHSFKVIGMFDEAIHVKRAELISGNLMLVSPTDVLVKKVAYCPLVRVYGKNIYEKKDEENLITATLLNAQTIALQLKMGSASKVRIHSLDASKKHEFWLNEALSIFRALDDDHLLVGKKNGLLNVIDLQGTSVAKLKEVQGAHIVGDFIVGWFDHCVYMWNKTDYKMYSTINVGPVLSQGQSREMKEVTCCSLLDPQTLIVGYSDSLTRLFDIKTGQCTLMLDPHHADLQPKFLGTTKEHIVVCYSDGTVHFFERSKGNLVKRLPCRVGYKPVFFVCTDTEIYITYDYGSTYIWSMPIDRALEKMRLDGMIEALAKQRKLHFLGH